MTIIKMSPEQYSASFEYVPLLLEMMEKRGIPAERMLEGMDLPDRSRWNEPGLRILASDNEKLVRRALALSGEPWLGWEFGLSMGVSTHGFLGYAAMSSATMGDAIDLAVKFFRTRSTIVALEFFVESGQAVIQANEQLALNDLASFTIESLFSSLYFMGQKMLADRKLTGEVRFAYPEPPYFEKLKLLLPGPSLFDCPHHQLRFDAELLTLPLKFADPRLSQMAESQCEEEMAGIQLPPALLGQVKRVILAEVGNFPNVDEVANQLHMSSRTLKRKLQQLGTSYQKVLDDLRRGLAVEYLTRSRHSIDEIASLLGYSDASNFARAFRRWTGKNPSDYRQ
jgi:AraC-like DNA-binding protein